MNDENEMKFLGDILGAMGSWCGLNNQNDMNVFEWVSGEQSDYTYWALKEPRKSTKKRGSLTILNLSFYLIAAHIKNVQYSFLH